MRNGVVAIPSPPAYFLLIPADSSLWKHNLNVIHPKPSSYVGEK